MVRLVARLLEKSHLTPRTGLAVQILPAKAFVNTVGINADCLRTIGYFYLSHLLQNGLATTSTTIIAAAIPGTSLNNRNCLPVSVRSPFASFFE